MANELLKVSGLGKSFPKGHKNSDRVVRDAIDRFLGRRKKSENYFWALKEVSFHLEAGQGLAVLGSNGSGKSTLLKIVAEVLAPSTGRVEVGGRVFSLLQAGAGFHAELTGRDNIFMKGALLGFRHREVREKLRDIIEFSELQSAIDLPIRHYSSGMSLKLALSLAMHLRSEILLVDEALSVGDEAFRQKCYARILDLLKEGRALLMVTHDSAEASLLCTRGLLLNNGVLQRQGTVSEVISSYREGNC